MTEETRDYPLTAEEAASLAAVAKVTLERLTHPDLKGPLTSALETLERVGTGAT